MNATDQITLSMGNEYRLFFALPTWYFGAALSPFSAGALSLVPAIGAVCLLVGTFVGIVRRQWRLAWFGVPMALSQVCVVVAGVYYGLYGRVPDAGAPILGFLAVQLALTLLIGWRCRRSGVAALLLAIFNITYATFAGFIAGMALTDRWL
jgi:hypothetical protein